MTADPDSVLTELTAKGLTILATLLTIPPIIVVMYLLQYSQILQYKDDQIKRYRRNSEKKIIKNPGKI